MLVLRVSQAPTLRVSRGLQSKCDLCGGDPECTTYTTVHGDPDVLLCSSQGSVLALSFFWGGRGGVGGVECLNVSPVLPTVYQLFEDKVGSEFHLCPWYPDEVLK